LTLALAQIIIITKKIIITTSGISIKPKNMKKFMEYNKLMKIAIIFREVQKNKLLIIMFKTFSMNSFIDLLDTKLQFRICLAEIVIL